MGASVTSSSAAGVGHRRSDVVLFVALLAASLLLYLVFLLRCELVPAEQRCLAQDPVGMDFVIHWAASFLDARGLTLRIFDVRGFYETQTSLLEHRYQLRVWSYPPHFLLLLRPLAWLPYLPAYLAFCAVTFALSALACARGLSPRGWMLVALALAPASFVNAVTGQNGFLSAALLVGGMALCDARPLAAGALFGLLTFKPQLGLLVPVALLATRSWRVVAAAAATSAALVGASLWLHGPGVWQTFLEVTVPNSRHVMEQGHGVFTWMVPSTFMGGRLLGASLPVAYAAQGLVTLVVAIATWWGCRRAPSWELRAALVGTGTFLASPYAFNYDMTLLSAAVLLVVTQAATGGFMRFERLALVLAWLLPLLVMPLNAWGLPLAPLVLTGCFLLVLRRIEQTPLEALPAPPAAPTRPSSA